MQNAGGDLEGCLLIEFLPQNHSKKKESRRLFPGSGLSSSIFLSNLDTAVNRWVAFPIKKSLSNPDSSLYLQQQIVYLLNTNPGGFQEGFLHVYYETSLFSSQCESR